MPQATKTALVRSAGVLLLCLGAVGCADLTRQHTYEIYKEPPPPPPEVAAPAGLPAPDAPTPPPGGKTGG